MGWLMADSMGEEMGKEMPFYPKSGSSSLVIAR
jgi:hypothetical protein